MGLGSARIFQGGDAGRLIGVDARRQARIDMGDAQWAGCIVGIKICIEHAAPAAELQLEAGPFAHLKRRIAEMADKLRSGEPEQPAGLARCDGRGSFGHRRLRRGGATGEEQGRGEDDAAHGATMPPMTRRGKVAGR